MPEDNLNEGSLDLVEDNQATQEDAQAATQPDGQVTEPAQEPDQTEPTAQHQADAQTPTDPDKRDPTKKIEQINYEVRNLSRRLDALLQRIEEQGKPATPQQQAQVEQLQDELSRIENDELADENDKALIRYLRQQQQQADERLSRMEQAYRQELQTVKADLARRQFIDQHPDLAGQYDRILESAQQRLIELYGHLPPSEQEAAFRYAAPLVMQSVTQEALAALKAATPAANANLKASTRPDKDTRGAQVKPPGAPKAPKPKSDFDDDGILPDLVEDA